MRQNKTAGASPQPFCLSVPFTQKIDWLCQRFFAGQAAQK
jgi:hypothetical protein